MLELFTVVDRLDNGWDRPPYEVPQATEIDPYPSRSGRCACRSDPFSELAITRAPTPKTNMTPMTVEKFSLCRRTPSSARKENQAGPFRPIRTSLSIAIT